jgi:altronate dehydratase
MQYANKTSFIKIHPADNVLVAVSALHPGESLAVDGETLVIADNIPIGHKLAGTVIRAGDKIIKYGVPIGSSTADIAAGRHVHTHNMRSDYLPTYTLDKEHSYVK